MYFFTSDTHFGHNNIRLPHYCNRPFHSCEDMDNTIIDNINDLVTEHDTLYHLGDFAFARGSNEYDKIKEYRDRIRCKNVILIIGNHDPRTKTGQPLSWLRDIFQGVYIEFTIRTSIGGRKQKIVLYHYAGRVWDSSHRGTWQLWAHSHYSLFDDPHALAIDVGVDAVAGRAAGLITRPKEDENAFLLLDPKQYRPISLTEIDLIMSTKTFRPVDHHRMNEDEHSSVSAEG